MARKPSRKTLKRNLDNITSQIVKIRDDYTCQKCNKKCALTVSKHKKFTVEAYFGYHWAHIYSRDRLSMRWLLLNALGLCAGCHREWHSNPIDSEKWFKLKYPHRYEYLQSERQKAIRTIKDSELAEWLKERKQKLKELQSKPYLINDYKNIRKNNT